MTKLEQLKEKIKIRTERAEMLSDFTLNQTRATELIKGLRKLDKEINTLKKEIQNDKT
jgi:hypothetical protein